MARTNAELVKGILGDDFGKKADGSLPSLTPFIRAAGLITDRVATCASDRGKTLTGAELAEVEAWLAAWFYTRSDPAYASKQSGKSGGTFISDPKQPDRYKAGAVALDYSGCLVAILERRTAGAAWIGKEPSSQIDYENRR